jgi:D-alanyl-D-alanine-carboxypeptidase/D-alanyl-D-alanine-endopeptidase
MIAAYRTVHSNRIASIFFLFATLYLSSGKAQVSLPSDADIRKVLIDRIDKEHESVGMVVGIISPEGRRIISYGHMSQQDSRSIDGNTIFEIGSVTKVFTALLLADMVENHEVSLDDPVADLLPKEIQVPERDGKKIALVDLATQTSGLPFWPEGIPANDTGVARMASYTAHDLYNFLSHYTLKEEIGTTWTYSNLGFGLLGHALSVHAGKDYEALIRERITNKLGMKSTAVTLTAEMKSRTGTGHTADLQPAPEWNVPLLQGCGSLHSTANDLLTFAGACAGLIKSPLDSALALMVKVRRPGQQFIQGLGWWIMFEQGDQCVMTHPGATLGYSSTIAYDPKMQVGVVVLSNSVGGDVGSIAWHVLRPSLWPWTTKAQTRKEAHVDNTLLRSYAGAYTGPEGAAIAIECDSVGIILKTPTTPPEGLRLSAENEKNFFVPGIDLQVLFQTDPSNNVKGLIIRFAGNNYPASKIASAGLRK